MSDPTTPQQRRGTSYSEQAVPAAPPPLSSTLSEPEERSWFGRAWEENVAKPFEENIARPFRENIYKPYIQPLWDFAEHAVEGIIGHPYAEARGRRHLGVDIACPVGTPVRALADCRVIRAQEHNGYGPLVVVDYGNGILGTYAHNSRINAQVGQRLGQGDILSLSGNRGTSSGPHVHEEMLVRGSDGRFYACEPAVVRDLAARGHLNTQTQRDTFIQQQADEHWNGNKDRMVPLLSDTYAQDLQRYAFNPTPDRALAATGPTPTLLGG